MPPRRRWRASSAATCSPAQRSRPTAGRHNNGISKLGYKHDRVVQRGNVQQPHQLLPHVHRVSALAKHWLLGTHQGSWRPAQLDYYLDEFVFRFNRRSSTSRALLFYRLIENAVVTDRHPYKDLVA